MDYKVEKTFFIECLSIERKEWIYDAFKLFNSSGLCKNIIGALCKILNVFYKALVNNFDNRLIIIIIYYYYYSS